MEIGLKCLLIVTVAANVADGFHIFRQSSFCNGQRKYLELGESGQLSAYNISVPNYIEEATRSLNKSLTVQCSLELVTCPSCVIKLKFNYVDFPKRCEFENGSGSICPCDHIMISEPPYDKQSNIIHNCGNMIEVQSRTRSIQLRFVYSSNYIGAFQVEYQSLRNRQEITLNDANDDREVTSPFFPAFYPRDYSIEHVISCTDVTATCRVHLEFSDFQLAHSSSMEFYDTSGEKLFVNGKTFRPPVLISSGPSLTIRFFANGDADIGYRAKASFLTVDQSIDPELKPRVGCGGMVESVGGAITMMNMVEDSNESSSEVLFDCIWIIRPPQGYVHMKSHISLRVDTFDKMSGPSTIDIIGGSTSDRPILEHLVSSPSKSVASRNLVVPITTGFYVRLKGAFNEDSRLAIVYTTFSYSKCYIGGEFLCANERCIPLILRCDGFSQCGDDSDELECTWANTRRYTHTPNYFFPKVERFPDLKTTTLAFIISCGSLVFVISCLILTLYRNGNRVREQEEFQNQLQTISQLLESNNLRPSNENVEPPPNYEAPPNYDEIIKIGMDDQINKSKRERRSGRKNRLLKLEQSEQALTYQNGLLGVFDDNDLPSTSSSYYSLRTSNLPQETLSSLNVLENSEAAEASEMQNNETTSPFLSFTDIPALLISSEFSSQVPLSTPNHLWSNDSPYRNSWILFNSEANAEANAAKSSWHETQNAESFDNHMKFKQALSIDLHGSPTSVIHECTLCKNLLLKRDTRRGSLMCEGCVDKLYSVKICSFCNGRVSFQGLKNLAATKKSFNQGAAETDQLCTCFPQEQLFQSNEPISSIHDLFVPGSSQVLRGESSKDELMGDPKSETN